jgi:hypothetical protein
MNRRDELSDLNEPRRTTGLMFRVKSKLVKGAFDGATLLCIPRESLYLT